MRARCLLLILGVLLLTASLAGATPPEENSTPALSEASAPEDPSCTPLLAKLESIPDPTKAQSAVLGCGACSVAICRGVPYNTICQGGGAIKRCIDPYGFECPADGLQKCLCWGGPWP